MADQPQSGFFCSDDSARAQEQLFATAPRAQVWLLLEYAAQWEPQAFEDSQLPLPVKNALASALKLIPRSRAQMIRHHVRPGAGYAFYLSVSQAARRRLYAVHLETYAELLKLNLPAMAGCDSRYDGYVSDKPLFLVCAHGSRDQCCALRGAPVYNALVRQPGLDVWQTSHIGGHRFAANVVCLPEGVCYGRMAPDDVEPMLDHHRQGRIVLDKYRGQSIHDTPAQAADYFARAQTGILDVDGLTVTKVEERGPDQWRATCTSRDGATHVVEFARDKGAVKTRASCKDAEPTAQDQFRLIAAG
jgi:hypothetical protein